MTTQPLRTLKKYWEPGTSTVLTLVILVTLLFFGTTFYLYVSQNYSYLVERNFRLLATWGTELSETFDNYKHSFQFRVQEQKSANLVERFSPDQSRDMSDSLTNKGLVLEGFTLNVESKNTLQMKSKEKLTQRISEQISRLPFVINVKVNEHASSETTPEVHQHNVTFSYMPNQPNGLVKVKVTAEGDDNTVEAEAGIALRDLLKHVATESIYDDVLLADPSGAIVYQRNPSTLKIPSSGKSCSPSTHEKWFAE